MFTLKLIDSAFHSTNHAHPATLGHECKDNITNERSHIEDLSKRENPSTLFKVYSKRENAFILITLFVEFITID